MGLAIKDIITAEQIDLDSLAQKTIAVDAYNVLFQFLTTIRGRDGSLLTDSKGRPTSHLVGLFSRTANLMKRNIKLAFVFDGKAPELKKAEQERRRESKKDAQLLYDQAEKKGDIEQMKKYGGRTAKLTPEIIEESKALLTALGIPVIQAPSEGEAQAAH